MRDRTRPFPARGAAAVLLAVLAAACSDFLAAPARGPAQLTIAYAVGDAGSGSAAPDPVDSLHVRLARRGVPVVDSAFALSADGGVVRRSLQVEMEGPEEEMELNVEMRWQGTPRFSGHATVRMLRGIHNTAEITLVPVDATGALVVEVTNALTGAPFAGAVVDVRTGAGAPPTASVAASTVTGADGRARFASLPAGSYTLFVTAPSMIQAVVTDVAVAANDATVRRVALSPVLAAGETRIVLTWGANPSDLDSHLTGPDGAGGSFHVFYGNRFSRAPSSTTSDAALDVDDISSFGPETITIYRQFAGTYCYSVHNFTGGSGLGASGAQVSVFRGSQQVATYTVPATTSEVWTVFKLSGSTITAVNTTGNAAPGTCP
jgi:hypothetical protein